MTNLTAQILVIDDERAMRAMQRFDGHKREAARALGIDRKTLREKLKRYNIE